MEDEFSTWRFTTALRRFLVGLMSILLASVLAWGILTTIAGPMGDHPLPRSAPWENDPWWTRPFWLNYGTVMTDAEDFDEWFTDVDAATQTIRVMLAAVVPPPPPRARTWTRAREEIYAHVQRFAEARERQVRLAHAEWRRFLEGRERLVRDMVSLINKKSSARLYVNNKPVNVTTLIKLYPHWQWVGDDGVTYEAAYLPLKDTGPIRLEVPHGNMGQEEPLDPFDAQSLAALLNSGRAVIEELERTYVELFRHWDPVQAHIREALAAERALVPTLRRVSPRRHFWTAENAQALPILLRRMEGLQKRHATMWTVLRWLKRRFPRDQAQIEKDVDELLETAKELLRGWVRMLIEVQEGVLIMLRKRDIRSQAPGTTRPETSWEAWKQRNCGGTSCYAAAGLMRSVARFLGLRRRAEVARDEVRWLSSLGGDATPRISRDVYEVACCKDRELAHSLERGEIQPYDGSTEIELYGGIQIRNVEMQLYGSTEIEQYGSVQIRNVEIQVYEGSD
ncbi:hypothetical protein GQX73_g4931 [Xylaria multiplex]|uniref:Uncharacterized protein n=1 Tax=Xylaria multiplex TaxID=323545 RepID=A0A7C8N7S3_9PEZI|nr:hypothetical protein GQX73_g4931 [Xylaria multiplex]